MYRVGVLAIQGGVIEHIEMLKTIPEVEPVLVRKTEDLASLDGLILPGGESTAIGKVMNRIGMLKPLKEMIEMGLPVWGTCAGMILLAKTIENQEETYLNVLDITVSRNAFGRQLESFDLVDLVPIVSDKPVQMRFIRAPRISKWDIEKVEIIYQLDGYPVAVKQGSVMVTSFHPELVNENCFHQFFVTSMVSK
jgi:5'-phosphate synthase pdxT subunit